MSVNPSQIAARYAPQNGNAHRIDAAGEFVRMQMSVGPTQTAARVTIVEIQFLENVPAKTS